MDNKSGFRITEYHPEWGAPYQAAGRTGDGRPFYWRAEGGRWGVQVGEVGWPTSLLKWPRGRWREYVAQGDYPPEAYVGAPLDIGVPIAALTFALGDIDPRSIQGEPAAGVTLDPQEP